MVYCLVGADLGRRAELALGRWYRDDDVCVLVERRGGERRAGAERRDEPRGAARPRVLERRRVAFRAGRRVAERRAMLLPASPLPLPRRLRRHAGAVRFATAAAMPPALLEDADTARLVVAAQSGRTGVEELLFGRYFDHAHLFARASLKDREAAEGATAEAMVEVLGSLAGADLTDGSFRVWLFARLFDAVERRLPSCPTASECRLPATHAGDGEAPDALDWLSDDDLELLVARLPWPERQVMLLRYLVGLSDAQTGAALRLDIADVRELHGAALRTLSGAVAALLAGGRFSRRESMRRLPRHSWVLRQRRLALLGS